MSLHIELLQATSPARIEAARGIMREYAESLGVDLCFQDFDAEMAGLPGDYAPPRGILLLAEAGGALAGCGAMRPFGDGGSEMKRVYVRPAFRSLGLGRGLAVALLDAARAAGHRYMVLDTLPTLHAAQALYISLGFRPTEPYNDNPVPGVRFMRADFQDGAPRR